MEIISIFKNSILNGIIISLMAVGFNFIFNAAKVFHLAQGIFYVGSVFIFYFININLNAIFSSEFSIIFSTLITFGFVTAIILVIEKFVYLPLSLKNSSQVVTLVASLGVYFFLENLINFLWGMDSISINNDQKIFNITTNLRMTHMLILH